jgi:hypothetical protein
LADHCSFAYYDLALRMRMSAPGNRQRETLSLAR